MIDKKFIKLRWHFPTLLIEMSALPSILYFLSVLLKDEQMAEKSARYKTSHHQSYESKIKTMNQTSQELRMLSSVTINCQVTMID